MVEKLCIQKASLNLLSAIEQPLSTKAYISLLKDCCQAKSLHQAKQIKTHLTNNHVPLSGLLGDYLVVTLARCGDPEEALLTSYKLPFRTVFSWTAIISSYSDDSLGLDALRIYRLMQQDGIQPDRYTFVALLKSCGIASDLLQGMDLHSDAICRAFTLDVFVVSSLINMYGKCDAIPEAEDVFLRCPNHLRNVVCWNAMLSAYLEAGYAEKAFQLFVEMQDEDGLLPYYLTIVIILQACTFIAEKWKDKGILLEIGRGLHAYARRNGFESNELIGSTLVNMYGKCGVIQEAEHVFLFLPEPTLVSWTAMLSAYIDLGYPIKVLQLYHHLENMNMTWDHVTLTCILQACSATGSLETCKQLHFGIVYANYEDISPVASTLIHAYGSCANMADGQAIFDGISEPTIVVWNACIAGHVGDQDPFSCLYMFEKLQLVGIFPDGVTFNSVISACSHSGHVAEGIGYFQSMNKWYGLNPDVKHYGSILDLVGRAGHFEMIESILKGMPIVADLSIWLCLLGACRAHGNIELARRAFDHAVYIKPKQDTAYIVMSNMYANGELLEDAMHA